MMETRMRLMRFFAPLLLVVALAACSPVDWWMEHIAAPIHSAIGAIKTVGQAQILNPLNDRTVFALGTTLSAANSLVVTYAALPLCPKGEALTPGDWCHDKGLLKTLYADMTLAVAAYEDVVQLQKTHPAGSVLFGGSLSQKFGQAQAALGAVTSLTNAYIRVKG